MLPCSIEFEFVPSVFRIHSLYWLYFCQYLLLILVSYVMFIELSMLISRVLIANRLFLLLISYILIKLGEHVWLRSYSRSIYCLILIIFIRFSCLLSLLFVIFILFILPSSWNYSSFRSSGVRLSSGFIFIFISSLVELTLMIRLLLLLVRCYSTHVLICVYEEVVRFILAISLYFNLASIFILLLDSLDSCLELFNQWFSLIIFFFFNLLSLFQYSFIFSFKLFLQSLNHLQLPQRAISLVFTYQ